MLAFFNLGLSDEARFDLFPETIRVAFDVDRRRVMEDPVEDGRGDHRVPKDLVPLTEAPVRSQDQGSLFVPAGDELEEQVRPVPIYGDVTNLVDDQELRLTVELQPLLDPVLRIGLGKRSDERHGLGEVGPIAFATGFLGEGAGQCCAFVIFYFTFITTPPFLCPFPTYL